MKNTKRAKNFRSLDMYERLCEGRILNKAEEAFRYGVDERSIQRDIDDIRAFLSEKALFGSGGHREIIYDWGRRGFVMAGTKSPLMSNGEILAVSKILLESRAFTKKEIGIILDKMIAGCVPEKNMKVVSDLLANEKYHYVELRHKKELQDLIWDLGEDIKKFRRIEIVYERQAEKGTGKKYIVEPVGLLFSEYYFYLNAYIVMQKEDGLLERGYTYPAIFRLDRIVERRDMEERFYMAYANRFEEGEFRKRIQFMYAGKLLRLQIRYMGPNADAVLDRLPTAKIVRQEERAVVIEAEVYGMGIVMWLLSQGPNVEVIAPESLRLEMKNQLLDMLSHYD